MHGGMVNPVHQKLWNSLPQSVRAKAMPAAKECDGKMEKSRLNNLKKEIKKWIWEGGAPFK